jgi:outer membrane protein TolC
VGIVLEDIQAQQALAQARSDYVTAVAEYNKAINDYVACIDKEVDDAIAKAGDKIKPEQKTDMQRVETQKHNAAIDQLQSVADRFNEQVKVFKAKAADAKKP